MSVRVGLFEATDQMRPGRRQSVLPVLEALNDMGRIELSHHERFSTLEQLSHGLRSWKIGAPSIAYIRANGRAGAVILGKDRIDLADVAAECKGKLGGKAVYFAWASVVSGRGEKAEKFIKTTGAAGVYGFAGPVDWWQGVAFDMLFFETVTRVGLGSRVDQDLTWRYPDLVKRTGFAGRAGRIPTMFPMNPLKWIPPLGG